MKFKVGDKVRHIKSNCSCFDLHHSGKDGVIIFIGFIRAYPYIVEFENDARHYFCCDCLELVVEDTKKEPKTPCGVVGCGKEATVHFCQECYDKKFDEVHGEKI